MNIEEKQVKELGERIGYGNLMHLASKLWRKMLRKEYGIDSGGFIPVIQSQIKPSELDKIKKYDKDLFED